MTSPMIAWLLHQRHWFTFASEMGSTAQELKFRHKYVVVRGHRRLHGVAHRLQVAIVENVVEHVGAASPGSFFCLYGLISDFGKLPDQRIVIADVEISANQCGAVRAAQLFGDKLALLVVMLA